MPTVSHTIDIDAPASRVWAILTDTAAYPEWNPFMIALDGDLVPGSRLSVTIAPPGAKRQRFTPTVTAVEPERRLAWLGRLLIPGIFDGAHSFELEALSLASTRFTQSERFSGVLVPMVRGLLRSTEAGFAEMNSALAARAEA
ncbi:SRPBCC domain-containing protein [Micromonospora sp. WMMD1082]|uniref:SRPBCC domain-containing protein n=1 Tax=Micromonospora sp. WMMD1082 TaxID=3016104 RepID=UPI0024178FEE|nr:SRPBCC domain-containing protein [Micromonospora sp. WMMD1082]MDG4798915.1 SRPBCC domain-containing protein [Micromonospora sp. WMMD1082]